MVGIEKLVKNFLKIDSAPKSKRDGLVFKINVKYFKENVDTTFDIFWKTILNAANLKKPSC